MKTLLRAVLHCVLVVSLTYVLHARTGEYVILTKSNFQTTSTTWSYTLTATAYTSGGTPITPQGSWQYYWEDYWGVYTITYGSNSITYQKDLGVEVPYVRVYLNGTFYDVSNDLSNLGDVTITFSEVDYYETSSEWALIAEANVFIDGNSVEEGQTYTWWVKRYLDGVADPGYWDDYYGYADPNQIDIDGSLAKPSQPCWTWQFYAIVEFQNDNTVQSQTIWLPMYFGHWPCGGGARIVDDPTQDGKVASEVPNEFQLGQNYPNPFNPETEITFALPEPSTVRLSVLDMLGREVAMLEEGRLSAGYKSVRWNGKSAKGEAVSSGMYFYRLTAVAESGKNFVETKKMLMTK